MGTIAVACLTLAALCGSPGAAVVAQDAVNGVIPGPPTFYQWVLPLSYDGSSFSAPKTYTSCGTSWDAQPYLAATDGPLILKGPVLVQPTCASSANPNNVPSFGERPEFYIVALPLSWRTGQPAGRHFEGKSSFPAIAIAGPEVPGADPWVFRPLQPGLKMQAGYGYMFFVAQLAAL